MEPLGYDFDSSIAEGFLATPFFTLNLNKKRHSRFQIQCLACEDSATASLSVESVKMNGIVNGVSSSILKEKEETDMLSIELGHGHRGFRCRGKEIFIILDNELCSYF